MITPIKAGCKPEVLPEALGHIVLELAASQVGKDGLHVFEDTHVVVLALVSCGVLFAAAAAGGHDVRGGHLPLPHVVLLQFESVKI